MNAALLFTVSSLFVCTLAFANDAENNTKETVDVSKNPITGTETTTKKFTKKIKTPHNGQGEVNVKEKTKKYKDGTVKTKTDASAETTEK